jgi:hypothetical protein
MFLNRFGLGAADFNWALRAARDLLAGVDPYAATPLGAIPYPLPAAFAALPFVAFSPAAAGALFFGLSSALLALGLARHNPQRLLIFLAYPYWASLMTAQWTPLLMSAAFFPLALAFCLIKPQIGAPVGITHLSPKGVIAAAIVLLASLLLRPRWPLEWLAQLHGYQHFIPLLVFPGPVLALSLFRWRRRDALFLLLAAIVPQRWFYDAFILWLIPKTRRGILFTVACSWCVGVWRWYHVPASMAEVGRWSVLGLYLPMLLVVLTGASSSPDIPGQSP